MRPPRDVLKHVCVEIAERRRKCHRDKKHSILKGHTCLVISGDGSFGGSKNYCVQCAAIILDAAGTKHSELVRQLTGGPPPTASVNL